MFFAIVENESLNQFNWPDFSNVLKAPPSTMISMSTTITQKSSGNKEKIKPSRKPSHYSIQRLQKTNWSNYLILATADAENRVFLDYVIDTKSSLRSYTYQCSLKSRNDIKTLVIVTIYFNRKRHQKNPLQLIQSFFVLFAYLQHLCRLYGGVKLSDELRWDNGWLSVKVFTNGFPLIVHIYIRCVLTVFTNHDFSLTKTYQ